MKRFRTHLIAYVSLAIAALLFLFVWQPSLIYSRGTSSAQSQVVDAWQRAQEVGIYDYQTDILQRTWPTPLPPNVGLSSQQERIYIEGSTNRHLDFIRRSFPGVQMKLWSDGGSVANSQNAIEIKVEDGNPLAKAQAERAPTGHDMVEEQLSGLDGRAN
jgi:hypothetical protein